MKKKILIIGKNSFIGKNLFIYLKKFFNLYIINFKQFKKIPKKKLAHYNFIINCSITKKYVSSSYSVKNDNDVYIANKIKNCSGLILVDGSKFSDCNSYFKTLEAFENSIDQETYLSVLENMFSSMFFSTMFDNHKDRVIKRAINIPESFSLPLRRNAIWYDSHCVEKNLNNLSLPILILHSTKLDTKIGRSPIRKNEVISYIDFIKKHSSKVRIELF